MIKHRSRTRFAFLAISAAITVGCATPTHDSGAMPDYHALVASADRSAADREIDARRNPEQFLTFLGIRAGMKVLDIGAGGGYTTELLARAVGPTGVVYAQNARARDALDERLRKPVMKNVVSVVRPFDDPVPPEVNGLDLVTMVLFYHDTTYMDVDRAAMNRKIFQALRPGGHFVVVDHSAKAGDGTSVGQTNHRIEEAALRKEVEAAGFRLVSEGNFLRNPNDPRDVHFRELKFPSDKFVLKFVKP
ncbi:MAG: class I SAM-dependent methyltransferase [Sulfurifustis sp.]